MARLTERLPDGTPYIPSCISYLDDGMQSVINKLAKYEDYADIFEKHFSQEVLEVLSDKEEFSKWLERGKWIARKCDEIERELQAFKRKQEQRLLVELPCKVGTTVYHIVPVDTGNRKAIIEHEADLFFIMVATVEERWDNTVFLTKQEAEESLRKEDMNDI